MLEHFLGQPSIPKLPEEERLSCEGRITIEECVKTLDTFENGKTPGNDGIPIEFYKIFWSCVGELMTDVFNYSFDFGEMSNSQKQAIITLIYKKDKDRTYLENWRPISLVNADSKLASKVISNRVKKVLPRIIHYNQFGFIKGRFIGEVARSIFDIIDHTESLKLSGILLFIDFEKAFDSIEWDFLYQALEAFNFGPTLIRWIKTFYNNVSSCVINNGLFSEQFKLERGVRQGDPLLPYLFVVAIEILAISLRSNEHIEGIKIDNDEIKTLLYADDMTATLANTSSVETFMQTLHNFEKCSGLKMNISKTKAMWIGASKHSLEKPLGLEWCSGVKTLGIHFSCEQGQIIKQNFHERLSDFQKTINLWSLRGLSLFGKVTIVKSFLIPKLLYVSTILETPQEIIKQMERMLYKFLWKGPDKVTRLSVINSLKNGGLNLTDLQTQIKALRLSWIPRVFDERVGPWKSYLAFHLKKYGGSLLLKCDYDVRDLNLRLNGFYQQLLSWWADFRNAFSDINYAQYVIWNNKDIRVDNKSIFYKKYVDCGIVYLNDLLFSLDNIRSFEYLKNVGLDSNFLTWSALRLSVPKDKLFSFPRREFDPLIFKCKNTEFDTYSAKSKQFYSLLIHNKAKYPNGFKTLSADLELSNPLQEVFSIPYNAASETYVWSFQYKILNNILFTNTKLFKFGLSESEKCSFCTFYKEDLYHLFYGCSYSRAFWNRFCDWWTSFQGENLSLSLKDVIVGILNRNDLLNYLIILGKLCLWECRRKKSLPKFNMFLQIVEAKQETEKRIASKNKRLQDFWKRWEPLL